MKRRKAFKLIGGVAAASLLSVEKVSAITFKNSKIRRIKLSVLSGDDEASYGEKRVPFGWEAFSVGSRENSSIIKPEHKLLARNDQRYFLRFTTAIDSREVKVVEVIIPGLQEKIGELELRFAPVLNMFEIELSTSQVDKIKQHGIQLKLSKGTEPVWFFEHNGKSDEADALLPHIMVAPEEAASADKFLDQLLSANTLQPMGWMEGCVLDAFWQLYKKRNLKSARKAIDQHLSYYFADQNLVYEDARSSPADNRITTIEFTLPFAILAQVDPAHPVFDLVTDFWRSHTNAEELVLDGDMVSAEGSYTIAYPMAVLGAIRNDQELMNAAARQLRLRQKYLKDPQKEYYLRHHFRGNNKTFRFWARGMAWYLLGLARTLPILEDKMEVSDLIDEFREVAGVVSRMQMNNGLWSVFLTNTDLDPDTSGSSGIAAALAAGVSQGYLPETFRKNAAATWQGLQAFLTPDGFLRGAAQSNRGGESLQESNYRVISQMGMGLMGQLYAEL